MRFENKPHEDLKPIIARYVDGVTDIISYQHKRKSEVCQAPIKANRRCAK